MTAFWTLHAPATLAMVMPVLMMPGLDFAAISRNAIAGGRAAGLAAAGGNTLGAGLWIVAAAIGTGEVLDRFPGATEVMRLLGSLVLLWFAWRFLSLARSLPSDGVEDAPAPFSTGAFRDGALAALLNPKTPVFFAAVFGASGIAAASLVDRMGFALLVCLLHFGWFAVVAIGLSRLRGRAMRGSWLRRGAQAIAMILACAGIWALVG